MQALAHLILPFSSQVPADAIAASMARFRRGRPAEMPAEWLRFDDLTGLVRELHRTECSLVLGVSLTVSGGEAWLLDGEAIVSEMRRRGLGTWTVRFVEVEPDLDEFAGRFTTGLVHNPATGGWGRWENPVGVWDWWDLGGCFDGVITTNRSNAERTRSTVSSGRSSGRDALDEATAVFSGRGSSRAAPMIDVRTDDNIEIVSKLLETCAED